MKDNFLESDSFSAQRVVVFGINRIQSSPTVNHVKEIARLYDDIISAGIDDVYCVSFDDFPFFTLLMPKFSKDIKFIQEHDSLIQFQRLLKKRGHPVFLKQYWQFACVLNNNVVEYYVEQPFSSKLGADTNQCIYREVGPEKILEALRE